MAKGRLLVTGAAGFTGRHLIEKANADGYHCIAMANSAEDPIAGAAEVVGGDLLAPEQLAEVVKQAQPDYVIHLAAISFVAHGDASELYQVNLIGTLNLLQALKAHAPSLTRVLVASSGNIYGNSDVLPITEAVVPAPGNHYGVTKLAMEQAALLESSLPVVIARPFNYTGVGQAGNFLVPKIVNAYRNGTKHLELGNLDVSRDFSDVRDVVEAYLRLIQVGTVGEIYNVCSGSPHSLEYIVNTMNRLAGYELTVSTNPEFVRKDEIKVLYGSPQKLTDCVGEFALHRLNDTLNWMYNT